MRPVFQLALLAALSAGCALRPTYRSFVPRLEPGAGPTLKLTLLDSQGRAPLANVKVELGELKNRYSTTTAADGTFELPREKRYYDDNPVLVVAVPVGVTGYLIEPVPQAPVEPQLQPPSETAGGAPKAL